jgi:hypothetical protein
MKGERGERWRQLCAQAAEEQDPDRLMQLVRDINQLFEEKEQRLKRETAPEKASAAEGQVVRVGKGKWQKWLVLIH